MNKVATIDLSGKRYAQVKDRIKAFREMHPNGLIETTPTITDTHIVFKARILTDKAVPTSAEATGHSMGEINKTDRQGKAVEKVFEKQESIAVGRALALLGFMGDGEIASGEEMVEFQEYKEQQKLEAMEETTDRINACTSIEELTGLWTDLNGEMKIAMNGLKETKKTQLNEKATDGAKKPRVVRVAQGEDNGVEA